MRLYRGFVSERATLRLRRVVRGRDGHDEQGETVSIIASEVERVGGFVGESFSELVLQGGILAAVLGYSRERRPIRGAAVAGSQAAASVPLSRAAARRAALFSS